MSETSSSGLSPEFQQSRQERNNNRIDINSPAFRSLIDFATKAGKIIGGVAVTVAALVGASGCRPSTGRSNFNVNDINAVFVLSATFTITNNGDTNGNGEDEYTISGIRLSPTNSIDGRKPVTFMGNGADLNGPIEFAIGITVDGIPGLVSGLEPRVVNGTRQLTLSLGEERQPGQAVKNIIRRGEVEGILPEDGDPPITGQLVQGNFPNTP